MNSRSGGGIVLRAFVRSRDNYDATDIDKIKEFIENYRWTIRKLYPSC